MNRQRFTVDGMASNGPDGFYQGENLPHFAVVQDGETAIDGIRRAIEQTTGDAVVTCRPDGNEGGTYFYQLVLARDNRVTGELWVKFTVDDQGEEEA
jgi:hypothetical protein